MWRRQPDFLHLNPAEVHVWCVSLQGKNALAQLLLNDLTVEERKKADQFYLQKDRERFTVTRGLLRMILGRYLNRAPQQLKFCYTKNGKPILDGKRHNELICFNLSHSQEIALYAVARDRQLGIDIEYMRPDLADEPITSHLFSPGEYTAFQTLPPNVRTRAFFNCWTRKEALLKAMGKGLTIPLNHFEVAFIPGVKPELLSTTWDRQEAVRWNLFDLDVVPGYAAALMVEKGACEFKLIQYYMDLSVWKNWP